MLPADPVKRGRVKLALLAAFFLLPIGVSWIVWWFDLAPGAAGNYGTLLPPRPAALPPLAALKGKWVLVQFDGGACGSGGDHRLAMALAVAGLLAQGETTVRGAEAVAVSYPHFWRDLEQLSSY